MTAASMAMNAQDALEQAISNFRRIRELAGARNPQESLANLNQARIAIAIANQEIARLQGLYEGVLHRQKGRR